MDDNNNNNENEEILKRKKIRRILLLKTDEELKFISKKKSNIMINSKTLREINKKYNSYNILLSEKAKVYFNFVKTGEKIVSNNIKQINSLRITQKEKKNEKSIKLFYNSNDEDSNSPTLNFIPKKIEVGIKKFDISKISPKNERKNNNLFEDNFNLEIALSTISKDDKSNKSIKLEKRGLFKLVDKIMNIKMNEDNENNEEIIKKNILILRKYCNKLRNPKKRIKRLNKQKTQSTSKNIEEIKEINNRGNNRKRFTITDKNFLKKKSLFEKEDKANYTKIKRNEARINTTKHLDLKIKEIDLQIEKVKNKDKKCLKRISSSKIIQKLHSINIKDKEKEKKSNMPPPNKRKIRKMQTLTGNIKNQLSEMNKQKYIKNKNSEINKNYESTPSSTLKNHLLSSKFERPKFQFNNSTNLKNMTNNKLPTKSKFNQLADKNSRNNNNKEKKEKKEIVQSYFNHKERNEKNRYSTRKAKRNSIKIYDKYLHFSRKEDKTKLTRLEKNINFVDNEDEIDKMNILSDFNRKSNMTNL